MAAIAVVAACAIVARQHATHWRTSVALWQHAVDVTGANEVAENNLAWELAKERRYDEAIERYRQAVRLDPGSARTHTNMALALTERRTAR